MPGSRGKVLDKFPQQVHVGVIPAVPTTAVDVCATGTFTETDWDVPVTLSLQHSTLLEAGRFSADLINDHSAHPLTQLAGTSDVTNVLNIAQVNFIRVWVMNERRTAIPSLADSAVLARFDFIVHMVPMSQFALATTFVVPDAQTEFNKLIDLQDEKTGQGLLVAQPKLFVYSSYTNCQDIANLTETAWQVRLSMHYRNVPTPSGKEFITELMAKFT